MKAHLHDDNIGSHVPRCDNTTAGGCSRCAAAHPFAQGLRRVRAALCGDSVDGSVSRAARGKCVTARSEPESRRMQRGRCCAVGAVVDAGTGHSSPNRTRAAPDVQCVCGIARACVCVCEAPPRSGFTGEYRTVAHEAEWMFRAARAHARILDSPAAVCGVGSFRLWCGARGVMHCRGAPPLMTCSG